MKIDRCYIYMPKSCSVWLMQWIPTPSISIRCTQLVFRFQLCRHTARQFHRPYEWCVWNFFRILRKLKDRSVHFRNCTGRSFLYDLKLYCCVFAFQAEPLQIVRSEWCADIFRWRVCYQLPAQSTCLYRLVKGCAFRQDSLLFFSGWIHSSIIRRLNE